MPKEVRFKSQIRAEGVGSIGFWEDDEHMACHFEIPLADIHDAPTDPGNPLQSRILIDHLLLKEVQFEDSDELDGKRVEVLAPDPDDDFRHGSHYICSCHNPITVHAMSFEVVDHDHMQVGVDLTVHYNDHGLGRDLKLTLPCKLYVEDDDDDDRKTEG